MEYRVWRMEGEKIKRVIMRALHTTYPIPHTSQKGFTLLLAALVGSIVLTLGSAIFGIAIKQVTLSSIGKNSQFAFYAADTAAECALFWDFRSDIHPNSFATSSNSNNYAQSITCDQQTKTISGGEIIITTATNAATTTFSYDITASGGRKYCADVSVAKSRGSVTSGVKTVIYANGYSSSCAAKSTDRDALQRSVELRY